MKKQLTTTLLHIIKDGKILLAEKKRGFGVGLFNGVGGKLEPGETVEQSMIRETQEEINVTPINYKKVAVINFDMFHKGEPTLEEMHVYIANDFIGTPDETEEMKPQWFDMDKIPYEKMFAADRIWMREVFNNKKLTSNVKFDKDFNLLEYNFNEVENV